MPEAKETVFMKYVWLKDVVDQTHFKGFSGKFVSSERMTFVFWEVEKGALLPEHSHMHEQVAHVMEGQFELTVDGETTVLEPGTVFVIPPNAIHSGRALSACRIIDSFAPVREDYLAFERQ